MRPNDAAQGFSGSIRQKRLMCSTGLADSSSTGKGRWLVETVGTVGLWADGYYSSGGNDAVSIRDASIDCFSYCGRTESFDNFLASTPSKDRASGYLITRAENHGATLDILAVIRYIYHDLMSSIENGSKRSGGNQGEIRAWSDQRWEMMKRTRRTMSNSNIRQLFGAIDRHKREETIESELTP